MLQKTPAEQENGLSSIIRTFDPDVPGYVFWLVMLMLIHLGSMRRDAAEDCIKALTLAPPPRAKGRLTRLDDGQGDGIAAHTATIGLFAGTRVRQVAVRSVGMRAAFRLGPQ